MQSQTLKGEEATQAESENRLADPIQQQCRNLALEQVLLNMRKQEIDAMEYMRTTVEHLKSARMSMKGGPDAIEALSLIEPGEKDPVEWDDAVEAAATLCKEAFQVSMEAEASELVMEWAGLSPKNSPQKMREHRQRKDMERKRVEDSLEMALTRVEKAEHKV